MNAACITLIVLSVAAAVAIALGFGLWFGYFHKQGSGGGPVTSASSTSASPTSALVNNEVPCKFSNRREPMMQIRIGNATTYVVFDTGSSLFWVAGSCIDQCRQHMASIGGAKGQIEPSDFSPNPGAGLGVCGGGVCAYGGCGCLGPNCAEQGCGRGQCSVPVDPAKAKVTFGNATVCTYVARADGKNGYASRCAGMSGIAGASDFTRYQGKATVDTTCFLYYYFMQLGQGALPKDRMNVSFAMTAPPPQDSISIKLKFQDTDETGVRWIKRYTQYAPFMAIRLLRIKADDAVVYSTPQIWLVDSGSEAHGFVQQSIVDTLTPLVSQGGRVAGKLPVLTFVFEGETPGSEVEWSLTKRDYFYDQDSLSRGKLETGSTFGFGRSIESSGMNFPFALIGNLFTIGKRVIFDYLHPRLGMQPLVSRQQAVRMSLQQPTAVGQPLQAPRYLRTPRIQYPPPPQPHHHGLQAIMQRGQKIPLLQCPK